MGLSREYVEPGPTPSEVGAMRGPLLLEFGNAWCGHCRAAQPLVASAFEGHDAVAHIKVADGPGRRLGRAFRVKLWPTLVFLRDGVEVTRLVRPTAATEIREALRGLEP